jgi:hypothetical protein
MVSVTVTPNVKNPLISVQGPMLGGAAVKYTFKFVVDIHNPDALATEKRAQWNRLHRGETPKSPSRSISEKEANSTRTFAKGMEKASVAAKKAKEESELQDILRAGGKRTRKNGKRSTLRKKRKST